MNTAAEYAPLEDTALLTEIARAIVSKPEAVEVFAQEDDEVMVLFLTVAEDDLDSVLGRGGTLVAALRRLFTAVGLQDGRQVRLKVTSKPH
jgi:predicted RNA-binding protein YlqC (UPF0109 family)